MIIPIHNVDTPSNWRFPDIPGLKDYQGILLHTANWDDTTDLADKNVAVIGNGSSGIQVVAAGKRFTKSAEAFILFQ